jgi:hypothetical protein
MSRLPPSNMAQQQYASQLQQQNQQEPIVPRCLELSLDPVDGSLLTAPLLSVLMAATDGLYNDLYQMSHGELEIGGPPPGDEADPDEGGAAAAPEETAAAVVRKEKMSSLSFAQRRHELSWRMASHGKVLTQVAALTAAAANADLSTVTRVSTRALKHARTAWVQADEAQDALYFFHAQLFPARQAPHDVYGAMDTLLTNSWHDLPQDLQLTVDRYEQSQEKAWPAREVADQWHMAVRDKLLLGEMGWMKLHGLHVPWKISVRGGIVRLTHGMPKTVHTGGENKNKNNKNNTATTTAMMYPLEAIVTVLSTSQKPAGAVWTLVSVEAHAQAKTGQSNHQVDATNRQRFDLHRLCALAMAREESRALKEQQKEKDDGTTSETNNHNHNNMAAITTTTMARPLHALFQVAQIFELSWQLEILSAQAQALKQVWGTTNSSIVVTPVQFFENRSILGMVSISFWSVDDRYGPPCMGDLHSEEDDDEDDEEDALMKGANKSSSDSVSTVSRSINTPSVTNQLTLSIRAEPNVGVRVSLSGAESVMEFASVQPHIRSTIQELLEATSNPFCLSASEALLAATRLCAERKCHATVQALPQFLPSWIRLSVEKGAIAVAAKLRYHNGDGATTSNNNGTTTTIRQNNDNDNDNHNHNHNNGNNDDYIVLFRLTCDARTGTFAATFSRSTKLLQYMACNDIRASSNSTALRIANMAKHRGNRAGANFTSGRAVRDAFDGLSRSMNVLGQRTGVGGAWKDTDDMSASLRVRAISIACKDVRVSLLVCCGMASVYGLSAVAVGVATGVAPSPDM